MIYLTIFILYLLASYAYFVYTLKTGKALGLEGRWIDYIFVPGVFIISLILGGLYILYTKIRRRK